jgi:hypothetical protein
MQINKNVMFILFITNILLFCLCGWLIYNLIDQSITLDHQTQQIKLVENKNKLLLVITNSYLNNYSEIQIRKFLETISEQTSSFEKEEGHLIVNEISFFFENGKLIQIISLE